MITSLNRSRRKKKYFGQDGKLILRRYTGTDLCKIFGMSYPTFQKQSAALSEKTGKKTGYYFSVKQVTVFTEAWGTPGGENE